MTIADAKPGDVVDILYRGIDGELYSSGHTVKVGDPVYPPGLNQVYVWTPFRQGKTKMHNTTPCQPSTDTELKF